MSQTFTISTQALMLAPPALLLTGGLIVAVALRGFLTTGIEVARLNADNDDKTARWLWRNGYRKTPHAGPDITPELPAADPHVTGELLAIDGVDTETDAPHEDTDRAGMWRVLLGLASELVDRVHDWLPGLLRQRAERDKVGSGEQAADPARPLREVLAASGYELDIADEQALDAQRAEWVEVNEPYTGRRLLDVHAERDTDYRSRHTAKGYETGVWSVIDAKVPAQRTGDADA